jgi:hypothetical protein
MWTVPQRPEIGFPGLMQMSAFDQGRSSSKPRAARNKIGSRRLLRTVYLCAIGIATFGVGYPFSPGARWN